MATGLSGRRAEAERNHGRILDAAREVLLADPDAPVATVAARAGVGISAMYRRYATKEDLLRAVAADGLRRYIDVLQAALDDDGDPWQVYVRCLEQVVAGQSQALAQRMAGTFTPTAELTDLAREAGTLAGEVHRRAQRARVLRRDVSVADVTLLLEMIMSVELPDGEPARLRYLALVLQALRSPARHRLPGRPADEGPLAQRWRERRP